MESQNKEEIVQRILFSGKRRLVVSRTFENSAPLSLSQFSNLSNLSISNSKFLKCGGDDDCQKDCLESLSDEQVEVESQKLGNENTLWGSWLDKQNQIVALLAVEIFISCLRHHQFLSNPQ